MMFETVASHSCPGGHVVRQPGVFAVMLASGRNLPAHQLMKPAVHADQGGTNLGIVRLG